MHTSPRVSLPKMQVSRDGVPFAVLARLALLHRHLFEVDTCVYTQSTH